MKYRKASDVLPPELLAQIQKHIHGEAIYIPKIEGSRKERGGKDFYTERNRKIREKYSLGVSLETLSEENHISEDAIKKVVYKKRRDYDYE
jgi:Mor family transcriptional regulator